MTTFSFTGTLRGRSVAGTVMDGVLDAPVPVTQRVREFVLYAVPVAWANMAGPATLRGPLGPATISAALDEGSVRFEGLTPLGPELPDLEGTVQERRSDPLHVGAGHETGGQFTAKVVPAIGKGQPTSGPAVGRDTADPRDLFDENGKTIFGHTLPPNTRLATDEERRAARIPKGYPAAFVTEDGSPTPAGIMGWGVDSKGRVKRFYTDEKIAERAKAKFQRIRKLSRKLDGLDADLAKDSLGDDRAACALLVRTTGMRPGSTGKTGGDVQAFGATTLQAQHVTVDGTLVTFDFIGKNGKQVTFEVDNHLLARSLEPRLQGKAPGDDLYPGVNGTKLNGYLKDALGAEFKTKDLRTALATAAAQAAIRETVIPEGKRDRQAIRTQIATQISERLGNTPAEVIKSYVDPQVWEPLGL